MTEVIKKETPATEVSAISVSEPKTIVNFNAENLISQAIQAKLPVDTMERLLAMRRELKAEYAKEAFDRALANFQSECPIIHKSKKIDFVSKRTGNRTNYSYAPIDVIVSQVKEILKKHGFSYSLNTKTNGQVTAICKITHELGHSQESEFSVPIDKDAFMNEQQKVASAMTFAKRYAFCNSFGILTGDEDNDASHIEEKENLHPQKTYYDKKPTEKQLKYIEDLAEQKGLTKQDVIDLQNKQKRNPSDLIEFLKNLPFKSKEELPVIEQEEPNPELDKMAEDVPF